MRSRIQTLSVLLIAGLMATGSIARANNVWVKQNTGTLAWLHAVYFVDDRTGWVGGADGTLLSTTDGGQTWKKIVKPTEDSIRDLYFENKNEGWMLCQREKYKLPSENESGSYLMRSTDSGQHWKRVEIDGNDGPSQLVRFAFTKRGTAWLFGEAGMLLKSVDNGSSWKRQPSVTRFLLLGADFVSDQQGWFTGAGDTIIRTGDGGSTWRTTILRKGPEHIRFNSVSFVDGRFGWIVGSVGSIYSTIDSGATWSQQNSNVDTELRDVKFVDASDGWASGADGTLLSTHDGGTTWQLVQTGTRHPLERISAVDREHAWVVGFGGTILSLTENSTGPALR